MSLYGYRKAPPGRRQSWRRFWAGSLVGLGLLLLIWVAEPFLRYQFYRGQFAPLLDPLAGGEVLSARDGSDRMVNLENWFVPGPGLPDAPNQEGVSYFLTIPKLKIYQANVIVGARSLDKNLAQYPGTAMPGQPGNTVILGHSVLPQFFNPDNYLTIFSWLYRLKQGDRVLIDYGQKRFVYQVDDLYEISPKNLQPLRQDFHDRTLTLITCSPPGTSLRRLIVTTHLVAQP